MSDFTMMSSIFNIIFIRPIIWPIQVFYRPYIKENMHSRELMDAKVKVIGLEKDKITRLEQFKISCDMVGFRDIDFIKAIDGDKLPISTMRYPVQEEYPEWKTFPIRKRGYAFLLSFIKCLEEAYADQLPMVVICQDDCVFEPNLMEMINAVPDDWDFIKLGGDIIGHAEEVTYNYYHYYRIIKCGLHNQAIVINQTLYDTLINTMSMWTDCFNDVMNSSNIFQRANCYGISAGSYQLSTYSNILQEEYHADSPYNPNGFK